VKYLREITPAGTTGPLIQENLRVLDVPQQQIIDLSVFLSGKFKVYTASKGSILICVP